MDSKTTGVRATGYALALNSVENRVYEVGLDDDRSVVTKFYRPGRWTEAQLLEEHAFIQRLYDAEIPVVPPIPLAGAGGKTLAQSSDGIYFTVFPKVKGRLMDELDDSQVRQVGRLLARLHRIGESPSFGPSTRNRLDIETFATKPLQFLLQSGFLDAQMSSRYESIVKKVCEKITPLFLQGGAQGVKFHRVHGDCHPGNLLWTSEGSPFFVDFDDMVIAPAVQDLWMVIRGRDEHALQQREELITGYEIFREFDRSQLQLIEPLRALRLIHYSAWIAHRWKDPSFPKMFPDFGSQRYWQEEIEALDQILSLLQPSYSYDE